MPILDNLGIRGRLPHITLVETVMLYVFGLMIFALGFQVPNLHPLGMDQSWNAVLAYGFEKGWSYGKDIIFTYGPWGWLENPEITLGTLWLKILWEVLFNGLLVAALISTACSFPKVSRWTFLISSLFFLRIFPDTAIYLLSSILLIDWCLKQRRGSLITYLAIIALAFLAEMKVTLGIMIIAGFGVIIIVSIFKRKPRMAAIYLGIFVVSCAFFWKLAGQSWGGIPAFLTASKEISGGYQNAMALTPLKGTLILGITVIGVNMLTLFYSLFFQRVDSERVGAVFVLLIVYILIWKHSFIRADGHVLALFSIAPMLSIYSVELLKLHVRWRSLYICTIIVSIVAVFMVKPVNIFSIRNLVCEHKKPQLLSFFLSLREVVDGRLSSDGKLQELHNVLGDSTVDVISYEQGDAINAGLNYRCRPVPQSYSAYTPFLLEKNADFYRSLSAPNAVLLKLQTIDARVPMMDDSLVLKEIAAHYSYSREVGGFALFYKKKSETNLTQEYLTHVVFRKEAHLWENIQLPMSSGPIWIKINARLSWIGKIRSMILQGPNVCIAVRDFQGKEDHFRVVPAMGKIGFLLSPWITTTKEFVTYSQTGTGKTAQSIRIQPLGLGEDCLWKSLEIIFLKD